MMKFRFYAICSLALAFLVISCSESDSSDSKADEAGAVKSAPTVVNTPYPSITKELADKLYYNVDFIDLIFYSKNFSVSLDEKPSIQGMLTIISTDPANIMADCPAQGRMFFQEKGEVIFEADIHYIPGKCSYLVFRENGKPTYANQMTQEGINLFNGYLGTGENLRQQGGAGH